MAGWGFSVSRGHAGDEYASGSGPLTHTDLVELSGATADISNVRAELVAVLEAVSWACGHVDSILTPPTNLLFAIDCDCVVKAFAKRGALRRHRQLVADIRDALRDLQEDWPDMNIVWHHIRSYTGRQDRLSVGNDRADALAKEGADMGQPLAFPHPRFPPGHPRAQSRRSRKAGSTGSIARTEQPRSAVDTRPAPPSVRPILPIRPAPMPTGGIG